MASTKRSSRSLGLWRNPYQSTSATVNTMMACSAHVFPRNAAMTSAAATMEATMEARQAGSVDPDLALAQCLQCIRRFGTDVTNGDAKALWRLAQIATEATTMLGRTIKDW